jgi:hypothetical protein
MSTAKGWAVILGPVIAPKKMMRGTRFVPWPQWSSQRMGIPTVTVSFILMACAAPMTINDMRLTHPVSPSDV